MPRFIEMPEANVSYAYGVYVMGSSHRIARRLRRESDPSIHGHRTWGSSYLLMDYLSEFPLRRGAKVLEVGCGWAPAGVFCAKRFNARVTGIDVDEKVFPFAHAMAALNDVQITTQKAAFDTLTPPMLKGVDAIVGSDICFWSELIPDLVDLTARAFKAGVKRIIITDPGRSTFFTLVRRLRKLHSTDVQEWYALEPRRYRGTVLEITPH